MSSVGKLGQLSDAEYTDLADRVDRFHASWNPDHPADPDAFLPPKSAPHRSAVLIELLKTDMELRAKANLTVRVEAYLARFPGDLPATAVPASLLVEEYLIRHRFADKPSLDEYRARFATRFPAMAAELADRPPETRAPGKTGAGQSVGFGDTPSERTVDMPIKPVSAPPSQAGKSTRGKSLGRSTELANADVLPAELEYKLVRRLGQGTFGEVYEAEAPGGFRVAVKKILRSVDHPASQGELESLEAIKTMSHPFLLQTQAYWVFKDRLVIVMELADGSLDDMMKDHAKKGAPGVPAAELIPFFEQAAEAVDYLHKNNVSHRDIKPQNILHQKGYAKLADFGLARMHEHTQTTVGSEMGTPLFMAPEVWRKKVSLHSDQYSLAGTYYMARTGKQLFQAASTYELAHKHMNDVPLLLGVDGEEKRVLQKALSKKPDERYPNCRAFAAALRAAIFPPPPPAAPAPRNRLAVGIAALGVAVLMGGIAFLSLRPAPEVVAPVERIWCPPDWQPDAAVGTLTLDDGTKVHKTLTRTLGPDTLLAHAVPPSRVSDPPLFYMLQDKISNRVMYAIWAEMEKNPKSSLATFHAAHGNYADELLPKKWQNGALGKTGVLGKKGDLGSVGPQAMVPAVGVTMPEASLAAAELGGRLPRFDQWRKATGALDGGLPKLPSAKWGESEPNGVALGLTEEGPWPVSRITPDVGPTGVRQLLSNGSEWTREKTDESLVDIYTRPTIEPWIRVVGQSWDGKSEIAEVLQGRSASKWTDTNAAIGFRIVLEPK